MGAALLVDKLLYVHTDRDRHGNVRVYFQRKGQRKIRMRDPIGSIAFREAYNAALKGTEGAPRRPTVARAAPSTFRWLCERYFATASSFKALAPKTRRIRRQILDKCFVEPVKPGDAMLFADVPISALSSKAIRVLRDRKSGFPEAGNSRVKAIRVVFDWALENEEPGVTTNPAREVKTFPGSADGFHTWSAEEVEQYEAHHPEGSKARLALALLMYTGARRSDVVRFGRQMIRDGKLRFTEVKGRTRVVKDRELPVLPELQTVIDATPRDNLTFLVTDFGAAFTSNGFGNWFRKRCNEAGLPQCSAHGCRKAGATIAADNGASDSQLMAIFGWTTARQAGVYTRNSNKKKLASDAMHLLVRKS